LAAVLSHPNPADLKKLFDLFLAEDSRCREEEGKGRVTVDGSDSEDNKENLVFTSVGCDDVTLILLRLGSSTRIHSYSGAMQVYQLLIPLLMMMMFT
jgi:hypothetical protein